MSKSLRIEFPGAVYHVTARGDRREAIFVDDDDRRRLLAFVKQAMGRFDAIVLAYCLMGNHYHFVLQTRRANLSMVMHHINAKFAQAFNRRHGLVGHLFQSRYKAILVDRDAYLMALCRYVELNPVRAGLVPAPFDWVWSSYAAHVGLEDVPPWLDTDVLHSHLLGRDVVSAEDRSRARVLYEQLVVDGRDDHFWQRSLRDKVYLGEEDFIARVQTLIEPVENDSPEMPRESPTTVRRQTCLPNRDETAWRMHVENGICMSEIARALNLSLSRVSRLVARFEDGSRVRREM
jgi:putative transposase